MRRSRFTRQQIVGVLQEHEAAAAHYRQAASAIGPLLLKTEVRRQQAG
jgi:hypothetical protein